jgi:hypothetical protein
MIKVWSLPSLALHLESKCLSKCARISFVELAWGTSIA